MDPNPHTASLMTTTATFEALILGGPDVDTATLHRLRLELMRAASDFLRVEQLQTDAAAATPAAEARRRIFVGFHTLRQRHSGHISEWTPRRIAAEWPLYRRGSEALIADLRDIVGRRAVAMRLR